MGYGILDLIARQGMFFTLKEAEEITSVPNEVLRVLLHRMERRGLIERIEREKYMILPPGVEKGSYSAHEFIIASMIVDNSSIAYWSALNHHGMTEQIPNTVFIQTKDRKKDYRKNILGIDYRIIRIKEEMFFGMENTWIEQEKIRITDPEKTIVDCLHRPDLCGGIIEVAKGLRDNQYDIQKLMAYSRRMSNSGIIRRMGYLSDLFDLDIPIEPVSFHNYLPLDPTMPESMERSSKWRLKINLNEKDLLV